MSEVSEVSEVSRVWFSHVSHPAHCPSSPGLQPGQMPRGLHHERLERLGNLWALLPGNSGEPGGEPEKFGESAKRDLRDGRCPARCTSPAFRSQLCFGVRVSCFQVPTWQGSQSRNRTVKRPVAFGGATCGELHLVAQPCTCKDRFLEMPAMTKLETQLTCIQIHLLSLRLPPLVRPDGWFFHILSLSEWRQNLP